jgi:helicase SWR1
MASQTCQTIAFLSWLKHNKNSAEIVTEKNQSFPHLVIAPASVVSNWVLEFQKFAPHLNVVKYHGSMNERMEIQSRLKQYLPNYKSTGRANEPITSPLDVIIAPVTYFQQEKSEDRYFLKKFTYEYMIVDEAHLLKNARGMRYKSLDRFTTMHRLLLTVIFSFVILLPLSSKMRFSSSAHCVLSSSCI